MEKFRGNSAGDFPSVNSFSSSSRALKLLGGQVPAPWSRDTHNAHGLASVRSCTCLSGWHVRNPLPLALVRLRRHLWPAITEHSQSQLCSGQPLSLRTMASVFGHRPGPDCGRRYVSCASSLEEEEAAAGPQTRVRGRPGEQPPSHSGPASCNRCLTAAVPGAPCGACEID